MIHKHYVLSEKSLKIIRQVMEEMQIKTENAAVEFLINQYSRREEQEERIAQRVLRELAGPLAAAAAASRAADQNTQIILDALNTILMEYGYPYNYPVDSSCSPVIHQSREALQKKIARAKQIKDDGRNRRK
ncbi:hypothetical protein [Emergencia sp. 1XD21-10]|uniref:hypothetical protein n=1 Tax=Emergencia sp. 1XD21-10 TaxID=2304569 RepID=UPI00137ACE0A|nr:hypothetical protein [Emergencia sp. 1XD21-10]NCE98097.1 hypothetical protein [Emergencia sp. 1XD21-10]